MYDAVIIGSGPAGLSAALNFKILGKNFVWFGSADMSEKIRKAEKIRNYPGLPDISGAELFENFKKHAQQMQLVITEKMVTNILYNDGHYTLLAENEMYEAKTLVLAMGVMSKKPLPGEERLLGNGVSYCATCDGMLYRGKTIGVISAAKKFEHEVLYLAGLAEKVYFFPLYREAELAAERVTVCKEVPAEITGEGRVSGIRLQNGETVPLDGVFCLRDSILPTTLLPGLAMEDGHILVNRRMETNLPGCFAAGDCTGRPYQYTKAVGEGNIAAHSAVEYLASPK